MNRDERTNRWQAHREALKRRWNRITDDELDRIAGDHAKLSERIQKAYGIPAEEADRQIADWEKQYVAWDRSGAQSDGPLAAEAIPRGAAKSGYMDDEDQPEMNESARADSQKAGGTRIRGEDSKQ